jgi:hypothetical protein
LSRLIERQDAISFRIFNLFNEDCTAAMRPQRIIETTIKSSSAENIIAKRQCEWLIIQKIGGDQRSLGNPKRLTLAGKGNIHAPLMPVSQKLAKAIRFIRAGDLQSTDWNKLPALTTRRPKPTEDFALRICACLAIQP